MNGHTLLGSVIGLALGSVISYTLFVAHDPLGARDDSDYRAATVSDPEAVAESYIQSMPPEQFNRWFCEESAYETFQEEFLYYPGLGVDEEYGQIVFDVASAECPS